MLTQDSGDGREREHEASDHQRGHECVDVDCDGVQAAGLQEEDGHELQGHARGQPCDDVRDCQQPGYAVGRHSSLQGPPPRRARLIIVLCNMRQAIFGSDETKEQSEI